MNSNMMRRLVMKLLLQFTMFLVIMKQVLRGTQKDNTKYNGDKYNILLSRSPELVVITLYNK